ncbi:MAG: hypothetical protein P1U87_17870, partial [Verrucomicrobiales bacterium]|nr:hypothetical protein [Verrucomicrobiales bacterium]
MRKGFTVALIALGALFGREARGDVTIDLQVGPLSGVSAARGFLVADMSGDGFSSIGPWVVGTNLAAGQVIGSSDDMILGVFGTSPGLPWPFDTGFGEVVVSTRDVAEGTSLAVYWIAGSDEGPGSIEADTVISRVVGSNSIVPVSGGTSKITLLTSALGGALDSGDIDSANTGNDPIHLSFNSPTNATIEAGGTKYFTFDGVAGRGIVLDLNGNESVSAEIFDGAGNPVGTFESSKVLVTSGRYFLALTETSGTASTALNFLLVDSEFRPDLWLNGGNVRTKRNNIYSVTPARQRYPIAIEGRASFSVVLENDSFLDDNLKLSATRLRRPFRETILDNRGNVLSLVLTG